MGTVGRGSNPNRASYLAYVLRRLVQGAVVVLGVALAVFFALRLIGDPVRRMLPIGATQTQYDELSEQLGFDKPLPEQLINFLTGIVHFDLGTSAWLGVPAFEVISERLVNTLKLLTAGMVLATILSLLLGTVAALMAGSIVDRLITTVTLVLLSLPWFFTGAILILLFAVRLGWLPTSGSTDGFKSLVLPAIALALPVAGRMTQIVRLSVLEQLGETYVLAARAKGMNDKYILKHHVPRNATLPILSFVGWETVRNLGAGTVVVETVFSYSGIGYLAIEAARRQDVILIQATVLVIGMLIVIIYLIFDLLYSWVDPRIRIRG